MGALSRFNHPYAFPWAEHPIRDNEAADNVTWWYRMLEDIRDATDELAARSNGTWQNLTLVNSWTSYTAGAGPTASWTLDDGDIMLRGLVAGGTIGVVATLPPEAAPGSRKIFVGVTVGGGVARIDVDPSGTISVQGYRFGGSNGYVSLDGVRYWGS